MRVNLYGPNGKHDLTLEAEPVATNGHPQPDNEKNTDPAADIHRKASFACMSRLKPKLKHHGVSDKDIWEHIKEIYKVESRTELTAKEWAVISARLNAAYRDPRMLADLVEPLRGN